AIGQRVRDRTTQEGRLQALREALGLPESVQRIECFDISHTMGEATVAACVVYDRQQLQKSEYRRFNIHDVTPGDDYAAMRQVLSRRYERVNAEAGKIPDLVLIDGGKGQVSAAKAAMVELGMNDIAVVGIAKGPERKPGLEELIIESEARTLQLPPSHPGLHLIQAIRDEAHRFAIVGHRARRGKARMRSMLNEIPGIGAKRRQALIEHFGGLRGVQAAAIGYLARRLNQMSAFGAFLDPVADKLIVVGALIVLLKEGRVDAVIALIIIGREIAISALREWMAKVGQAKSVAVAFIGKLKTLSQMIAIPLLLLYDDNLLGLVDCSVLGTILINVAAVLTVVSMLYYLRKALPYASARG